MTFEKRALRRIFGRKREVTGEWRKQHNEELHNLYSSPHVKSIRVRVLTVMRSGGHVASMKEIRIKF
jgi:hypothetical protein